MSTAMEHSQELTNLRVQGMELPHPLSRAVPLSRHHRCWALGWEHPPSRHKVRPSRPAVHTGLSRHRSQLQIGRRRGPSVGRRGRTHLGLGLGQGAVEGSRKRCSLRASNCSHFCGVSSSRCLCQQRQLHKGMCIHSTVH